MPSVTSRQPDGAAAPLAEIWGGGTWGETDLDTGTQCLPDGFSGLLITPNTYLCACPYIFIFLFFWGGGTVSLGLSAIIAILDNNNNNKEDF